MSDAVDRLAQALSDLINEAVQVVVERDRPTPGPVPVVERPKVLEGDLAFCPWCHKKHMRHLMTVKEARQQLSGISPTTSTGWSRKANFPSLRSVAGRSSRRKTSTISSGESGMTLPVERKLRGEPIAGEPLVAE